MSLSRRTLLGTVSLSLAASSVSRAGDIKAPSRSWTVSGPGPYREALGRLQAYVDEHRRAYGLPGLTVCVVDAAGYQGFITSGYADLDRREAVAADQLFQVGSISKSMTALCLFRALEAGKVRLDVDIRTIVPGVRIETTEVVTLQALLNHSSGLPDAAPLFPRGGDGALWLGFRPGAQWSYSNTGYGLLSLVVERLYGKPLEQVVAQEIFQPLGIAAAKAAIRQEDRSLYAKGYCPSLLGSPYPRGGPISEAVWTDLTSGAGNVAMAAPQMALYLRWLISAGRQQGGPLLSDAGARQWVAATIAAPGWSSGAHYANGLAIVPVEGRTLLHHTGGMTAFSSSMHVDPEAGVACFASTNLGTVAYRPRDITAYACGLFRTATMGAPAPSPASTAPEPVAAAGYVGEFEGRDGERLSIRASGSGVELFTGGQSAVLELASPDVLIAHHPRYARYALSVERRAERPVIVWYGDQAFLADAGHVLEPTPQALLQLAGRFDDTSGSSTRVVARSGGLYLDGVTPLSLLADGSWRPGTDAWSPERIRFDAHLNGVPQRMTYSGADLLRVGDRL